MIDKELLNVAYEGQYCIPAFNVENYDILDAILKASQIAKSPVIIQTTQSAIDYLGIQEIVAVFQILNKKYNTHTLLHYDHGSSVEEIKKAISYGYDSVMADLTHLQGDKFLYELQTIYHLCKKKKNIKLEVEIGIIPNKNEKIVYTTLQDIQKINEYFDIDSYAVSVGSIHGCREKSQRIDFQLLEKIHNEINKPLVIHGSSGVVDDDLKIISQYGVVKINIETELRMLYKNSLQKVVGMDEIRPRVLMEEVKRDIINYVLNKYNILRTNNIYE